MNSLQEKYNQLLIELTEFCDKNAIEYRLHGHTLQMAYLAQGYAKDYVDTRIEMTLNQVRRLIDCMRMTPLEGRKLEYMGNQKKYPAFSVRYSDPNTIYLPLNEYGNYQGNDMGIEIIILRKYPKNPWMRKMLLALEVGWELNCSYPPKQLGKKKIICKYVMKTLSLLIGRGNLAKILFNYFARVYQSEEQDQLCLRRAFGKLILLPKDSNGLGQKLWFEERQYTAPTNTKIYLSQLYKKKWDNICAGEKPGSELIIDERLNYQQLSRTLETMGINFDRYICEHRRVKRAVSKRAPLYRKKTALWKQAVKISEIMEDEIFYRENQEYTRALIENFSYTRLNRQLERYKKILNEKDGLKYSEYMNNELLDSYITIFKIQGKKQGFYLEKQKYEGV